MPKLTEYDRARGRLKQTRELELKAKRKHTAAQAALESARRRDVHPRREIVTERDAASKLLAKRRAQAAAAERAVARSRPHHPEAASTRTLARRASGHLSASSRQRSLDWLERHRGITESPAGSNSDHRTDGIRAAQLTLAGGGRWLIGQPWCGVWAAAALRAAGVQGITARLAAVAYIEDDARAHRAPFRGWTTDPRKVLRGDLVVLFGRGIHVETVRSIDLARGIIITDGGNTSSGPGGSQSNGGGAFKRTRSLADVHGFALVNYPG